MTGSDVSAAVTPRRRRPALGTGLRLLAVAWAVALAALPLFDNSWFTHLATGRIILDTGRVPSTDPYSFTAGGETWVVQSWLASVVYAGAEQMAGTVGIRAVLAAIYAVAALLVWRLTTPARSVLPRAALVFAVLTMATDTWSARPYMVSVIGTALLLVMLDAPERRPWLAVPLFALWANSHGGFPTGLVLVAAVAAGRRLDGRTVSAEMRLLGWSLVGMVTSVISPLGFSAAWFPLTVVTKSDQLQVIREWSSPEFGRLSERVFLVLLGLVILAVVRTRRWAHAVPVAVFTVLALVASRNVALATIVYLPALAAAFGSEGTMAVDDRPAAARPLAAAGALAVVLALVAALTAPPNPFAGYPARALSWLDDSDVLAEGPMATQDFTGNLLEVLDPPANTVFFDDRVDMYPSSVVDDYTELNDGGPGWFDVLDRHGINLVLWDLDRPLASLLAASPAWRAVYVDEDFGLYCRRARGCAGD